MRIGEVIGRVTLSQAHPSLVGGRFLIALPLSLELLASGHGAHGESIVVYDELGAGVGSRIGLSEGREASQPFYPERKPVDAYNACILDAIEVQPLKRPRSPRGTRHKRTEPQRHKDTKKK